MKKFIIVKHAKERMIERGATEKEIKIVLKEKQEIKVKEGRKSKEKIFEYGKKWLGKFYTQKKVKVIYVEEEGRLVVITVKVYYGKWR